MNSLGSSPSESNPRLNRIKIVSRVARLGVLGILVTFLWRLFFLQLVNRFPLFHGPIDILAAASANVPISMASSTICEEFVVQPAIAILLCIWYWKLMGLFRFYEQGLIFSDKTIRCLKILGLLCVAGWILNSTSHYLTLLESQGLPPPPGFAHSPLITDHLISLHGMGFFSFDFGTGINFGLLLAGAVIVVIAWIMDEGRKIQEEQALTI